MFAILAERYDERMDARMSRTPTAEPLSDIISLARGKALAKTTASVAFALVLLLASLAIAGCSSSDSGYNADSIYSNGVRVKGDVTGTHHAEVVVEGYEPFTIELDADAAPISVSNFMELAQNGYYDGLAFYRIDDGFVIQGGTLGNTASGSDNTLAPVAGEFSSNGYENALADSFDAGVVSMARSSDPNSATSTFFITLADAESDKVDALNGNYAAFGTIDAAGMEIVKSIVNDYIEYADGSNMGAISDEEHMPIIESITILD